MSAWVSVNGFVTPAEEARVNPMDHGFLYGDSVYETLRTYGGKPFLVEPHMERLLASGAGLLLEPIIDVQAVVRDMHRVLEAARYPESMIRIVWTRGISDIGYDPDKEQHPTVVVINKELVEHPQGHYQGGISVGVVDLRRNPITSLDPRLKTSNLLNPRLAHMRAAAAGADEALMLSQRGTVAEGSRTNFFVVENGRVLTASVETGILNGITRRLALQLCAQEGVPAEEQALPAESLRSCQEAFMTSTTMGIMPVTRIDGRPVGNGVPGPVTRRLMKAYDAYVAAGHWTLTPSTLART